METKHARQLTPEEMEAMEQAERDRLAAGMEAALGDLTEAEEEAARAISRRGEAILALFAAYPPDEIDRQLKKNTAAFASSFTLGVTKLGALDIAGEWYRKAAAAFDSGDYGTALGSFITTGTADELKADIDASRKDYKEKYKAEMTLADFLSRYPYEWKDGDSLEDADILIKTAKRDQILPAKESFFDLLLKKLTSPALPAALSGPLFKGEMAMMYSPPEVLGVSQIKTHGQLKAESWETFLQVTTPSEVQYFLSVMEDGYFPNIGTPELQLYHVSLVQLAQNNTYWTRGESINPFAYAPLLEYGEMTRTPENLEKYPGTLYTPNKKDTPEEQEKEDKRAEKALDKLRASIKRSGKRLENVAARPPGDRREDPIHIIYRVKIATINGIETIVVEFPTSAAASLLASGFLTMFDPVLLRIDKRNHSAFPIGIAITYQSNYDNNVVQGTDNRLKVKTLITKGKLKTLDELKREEKGRRDWKEKTLKPLEDSLDELIKVDFLTAWRYLDPKTHGEIKRTDARNLPYNIWENLIIEYDRAREQEETRRKARLTEKAEAAKAKAEAEGKEPERKKRGRPPKKKAEEQLNN